MILALDLATQTGWAAGSPCGLPAYGTLKMDAPRQAAKFVQMARLVRELIQRHEVRQVVLEAPFVGRAATFSALMPLFGFRAAAMMAAEAQGVPVDTVSPASVRKTFMGAGGLKRAQAKRAVIDKCRWLGHDPKTEDEADALALWHFQAMVLDPRHVGMFMRRGSFAPIGAVGDGG